MHLTISAFSWKKGDVSISSTTFGGSEKNPRLPWQMSGVKTFLIPGMAKRFISEATGVILFTVRRRKKRRCGLYMRSLMREVRINMVSSFSIWNSCHPANLMHLNSKSMAQIQRKGGDTEPCHVGGRTWHGSSEVSKKRYSQKYIFETLSTDALLLVD